MKRMDALQKQRALAANAVSEWRGIPAGLDEQAFNVAYDRIAAEAGCYEKPSAGFFEGASYGANMLWDYVSSGFDSRHMLHELYRDDRRRNFEDYQLATNARQASAGESFAEGGGQGLSFGFSEEAMSGLNALFSDRSYEELVAERRQLQRARRLANPDWYAGGEIAGAIPTVFIPVGGAAAAGARGATSAGRAVMQGAKSAVPAGAAFGGLSGAGHDEGGVTDRLDGAATGAATGAAGAAVLGGAGVLVARGVSKTRIWGRVKYPQGGALRRDKYGKNWPKGNLKDAIENFIGQKPTVSLNNKGKRIYENKSTGVQVVEDISGKYFRIFDPSLPGKRRYLDLDGNIPNNKVIDGRQVGRNQEEYNQITHFRIDE